MGTAYPELEIDMDVIVAGGLLHDVGKAWEFDPINRKRWKASQKRFGRPSIRHPAYGAHICLTVGLPEEIAHIAMAHSGEGELLVRSLECMIVHQADYTFWNTLLAGGQLKPETVSPGEAPLRHRATLLTYRRTGARQARDSPRRHPLRTRTLSLRQSLCT